MDDRDVTTPELDEVQRYCALTPRPARSVPADLAPERSAAIMRGNLKWVNGTVLHFYFFDDGPWYVPNAQRDVIRAAFAEWQALGIGLDYQEIADLSEAELRIGCSDDGSWSKVGRQALGEANANQRTMNFGWDLTGPTGIATARHEVGHTLGFEHEHQSPFSGIVWDEVRVNETLGGPPNNWTPDVIRYNVLRKLSPDEVARESFDSTSAMEYPFDAGLIKEPAEYRDGIYPPGTISAADKAAALKWYPPVGPGAPRLLEPFKSEELSLEADQQADFTLRPTGSRTYTIATFGTADLVMVLFEDIGGEFKYVAGADDSGTEQNAQLVARLVGGREYVLRIRLYWAGKSGSAAVMYW